MTDPASLGGLQRRPGRPALKTRQPAAAAAPRAPNPKTMKTVAPLKPQEPRGEAAAHVQLVSGFIVYICAKHRFIQSWNNRIGRAAKILVHKW